MAQLNATIKDRHTAGLPRMADLTQHPALFQWIAAHLLPEAQPSPEEKRRRARLLASLFIVAMVLATFIIGSEVIREPENLFGADILGSIFGIGLTFVLLLINHKGHTSLAAGIFSIVEVTIFVFATYLEGSGDTSLVYVVVGVLVVAMFFTVEATIAIASLIIAGVFVLNNVMPSATQIHNQLWYFLIVVNALVVTLGWHLRSIETLRRARLEKANEALRQSEANLEQRVLERTAELEQRNVELVEAREAAEEANRIKSQFLANMSHELRTPLNAILNFTAFVADGVMGPVNDEQVESLQQSISSGKHLLALINDILDVTKIEAGLMDLFIQEVDMNEVLNAVVAVGKGLVKDKPIELRASIADDLPVTYGDKRRLRQVFLNILSNAVKFTPYGHVAIRAGYSASHLHVEIEDSGIGIAPQDQPLVFESFKQARHELQDVVGTGLGMPISKYFVESHGGRMWLLSAAGVGTTFFVELPLLTEAEASALSLADRQMQ